ncbi:MAG: hypothetical protein GY739_14375 [Mesoflavibacter sp.]|nr:hypothetical protein [Mesoflavibacter sp.]
MFLSTIPIIYTIVLRDYSKEQDCKHPLHLNEMRSELKEHHVKIQDK